MSNCIQIIEGVVAGINRLALKGNMEQFGQVDLVHMGNRQNPEEEPPKVRFNTVESAQRALEAINSGQVCIDGMIMKARFMEGKGRGRGTAPSQHERNLEVTSRDLFLERERQGKQGGDGGGAAAAAADATETETATAAAGGAAAGIAAAAATAAAAGIAAAAEECHP
eukprot:CAMPEP_0115134980 /NCGR_PEP_ID=MMETSP0227-20121206/55431_1 /TAXON_ID=89957 /ORGANISM="Polarella glacialis, Strain CCMP 1383" /LENGTH=167 /DNA_ID=CAMNT_0002541587 /DNA_START=65 /DNA_END=569 /DNA_ORIENTATION=+